MPSEGRRREIHKRIQELHETLAYRQVDGGHELIRELSDLEAELNTQE